MRMCTFVGHSCNARAFAKHGMTRASPASGGSTTSYLQPDVNRERSDRVQLNARRMVPDAHPPPRILCFSSTWYALAQAGVAEWCLAVSCVAMLSGPRISVRCPSESECAFDADSVRDTDGACSPIGWSRHWAVSRSSPSEFAASDAKNRWNTTDNSCRVSSGGQYGGVMCSRYVGGMSAVLPADGTLVCLSDSNRGEHSWAGGWRQD